MNEPRTIPDLVSFRVVVMFIFGMEMTKSVIPATNLKKSENDGMGSWLQAEVSSSKKLGLDSCPHREALTLGAT